MFGRVGILVVNRGAVRLQDVSKYFYASLILTNTAYCTVILLLYFSVSRCKSRTSNSLALLKIEAALLDNVALDKLELNIIERTRVASVPRLRQSGMSKFLKVKSCSRNAVSCRP